MRQQKELETLKYYPLPESVAGYIGLAPFKAPNCNGHELDFGGFSNTAPYPVTQSSHGPFDEELPIHLLDNDQQSLTWLTAEHAYRGQILLAFRYRLVHGDLKTLTTCSYVISSIDQMLLELKNSRTMDPTKEWPELVNKFLPHLGLSNKEEFDSFSLSDYHPLDNPTAGLDDNAAPYTFRFMTRVIIDKLRSHFRLHRLAIYCAYYGIIPVKVTTEDITWGNGAEGNGQNWLGRLILDYGRWSLTQFGIEPVTLADTFKPPYGSYSQIAGVSETPYNFYSKIQATYPHILKEETLYPYTTDNPSDLKPLPQIITPPPDKRIQPALEIYALLIHTNVNRFNFLFHRQSLTLAKNIIEKNLSTQDATDQCQQLYSHTKSLLIFWRPQTLTKKIIDNNEHCEALADLFKPKLA